MLGDLDGAVPIAVRRGEGGVVGVQPGEPVVGTAEDHFTSKRSGMRPHVHHMVRCRDDVVVVLDDHHRVALVPQPLQHADELGGVFGMQPNAGLIQDVGASHEGASHAGAKCDALGLSTAECGAAAHQGQIAQPQVQQALKSGFNFPEQALGDVSLGGRERPRLHGGQRFLNRQRQELRQGDVPDEHVVGVFAEAGSFAGATERPAAVTADHDAVLDFVALRLQRGEEVSDATEVGAPLPNHGLLRLRQRMPRRVNGQVGVRSGHHEPVAPPSRALAAPRGHRAVVEALGGVGDDLVWVDAQDMAVAFARAACTHGAVEVEHVRGGLGKEDAVPLKPVVEFLADGLVAVGCAPDLATSSTFKEGRFNGVGHTAGVFLGGLGRKAVDDKPKDILGLDVLETHRTLCCPGARVSLLLEDAQLVLGGAVFPGLEWGDQHHARLGAVQDGVDHVRDRVLADNLAGDWRARFANAGIQHAQVVQDLRARAHGAAGTARCTALFNGHGGGEAVDAVHVGLFQTAQKLTGVAAEAFHVAALAFGVQRVEREAAFSGAAQPCHHSQFFLGNADVDVFEVVDAGALNVNLHCSF